MEENLPLLRLAKVFEARDALLRCWASTALEVAHSATKEEFSSLMQVGVGIRAFSVDEVAEAGRVDRTCASRWVNGHNGPKKLVRQVLLEKFAARVHLSLLASEERR